jgi:hypothetical protein
MLVTPAVLPTVGPGGLSSLGKPERNQNLAFGATWHPVYKPDIWD